MPSSFSDSRDDHLKRSAAFLREAYNRTNDDLLYRSAIGDAVEAIKHAFQAYLWQRAAEVTADERRQRWQITAADAKMPDLVATVQEAGLTLNRSRGDEVLNLNRRRNRLTHDSPRGGSRISARDALDAVKLAQDVRNAVVVALGGKPDTVFAAATASSAAPATAARTEPSAATSSARSVAASAAPTPAAPAAGTPATSAVPIPTMPASSSMPLASSEDDDEDAAEDSKRLKSRRGRTGWLVALAAVLALVVGLSGGVALGYPLGQGHVPSWLPTGLLPSGLLLASPTSAVTPTPTAPAAAAGPFAIGALLVTPSHCGLVPATLTLRDTGAVAVDWSAGSPDSAGAAFALAPTTASPTALARPTVSGRLAPGASVTLTITGVAPGAGHVVIVADGGTLAVPVGVC